jgi:orotidine-5'-phosphate decarboxylase
MNAKTQLIVALDVDTAEEGLELVDRIGDACTWYKVGKQLFTRFGPDMVRQLKERGKKVFLDLKFHDIPNTVREAVRSAAAIGADMTNVHASGGAAMLAAAAEGAKESNVLLIAVTVLTSMDEGELAGIGIADSPRNQVVRLAKLTQSNGVPGVVCSALEIEPLREACGKDFVLVVPGIRPAGSSTDDQKRVMTPAKAAALGADFIVVGRPIRCADDPAAAARAVVADLG